MQQFYRAPTWSLSRSRTQPWKNPCVILICCYSGASWSKRHGQILLGPKVLLWGGISWKGSRTSSLLGSTAHIVLYIVLFILLYIAPYDVQCTMYNVPLGQHIQVDTCHVRGDRWHGTQDTGVGNSYGLGVSIFKKIGRKRITQWIKKYKGACGTALATPGLLKSFMREEITFFHQYCSTRLGSNC